MSSIEALEHDTGIVPLGSDPDHCQSCRCAAAGHSTEVVTISTLQGWSSTRCGQCGASLKGDA